MSKLFGLVGNFIKSNFKHAKITQFRKIFGRTVFIFFVTSIKHILSTTVNAIEQSKEKRTYYET